MIVLAKYKFGLRLNNYVDIRWLRVDDGLLI